MCDVAAIGGPLACLRAICLAPPDRMGRGERAGGRARGRDRLILGAGGCPSPSAGRPLPRGRIIRTSVCGQKWATLWGRKVASVGGIVGPPLLGGSQLAEIRALTNTHLAGVVCGVVQFSPLNG